MDQVQVRLSKIFLKGNNGAKAHFIILIIIVRWLKPTAMYCLEVIYYRQFQLPGITSPNPGGL